MTLWQRFLRWRRAHLRTPREVTEDLCAEFAARFPGKCLICSYHRHGVSMGYTTDPIPPHECCEA